MNRSILGDDEVGPLLNSAQKDPGAIAHGMQSGVPSELINSRN